MNQLREHGETNDTEERRSYHSAASSGAVSGRERRSITASVEKGPVARISVGAVPLASSSTSSSTRFARTNATSSETARCCTSVSAVSNASHVWRRKRPTETGKRDKIECTKGKKRKTTRTRKME